MLPPLAVGILSLLNFNVTEFSVAKSATGAVPEEIVKYFRFDYICLGSFVSYWFTIACKTGCLEAPKS